MACIKITDLASFDSELMDELTDEDLFEINGGGGFTWRGFNRWINNAIGAIGGIGLGVAITIPRGFLGIGGRR